MPPRKCWSSRTNTPVTLQKGGAGQHPNKFDEQWNARFKELLAYKSAHGDCDVLASQGKLGRWVDHQRRAYRAGSLAQDRIDRLINIGFGWAFTNGPLVPWETRFDELVKYKAKHGDCDVPMSHVKLGPWVNKQRTRLSKQGAYYRDEKFAQDRIDRLSSIGFKWKLKEGGPKVPWETRFHELVQYKAKHGDCNVPRRQGPLGQWADKQRTTYKTGKLTQDRIDRLNGIGFNWTPRGHSRKRRALPSTRDQSSSRRMRVPSLSTNVESPSIGARTRGDEPDGMKGEGFDSGPSLPMLQIPSSKSNHNLGAESDDEVDEIGALIYDQVMRNKGESK